MPKLRPYPYTRPLFVFDNINSIQTLAKNLHITYGEIARETGIPHSAIHRYAEGIALPGKDRYNLLAIFFDWEIWD